MNHNYRVLMSVCVSVCMCLCVCLCHDNSKNNGSILIKLEHIVVYLLLDQAMPYILW